MRSQLLHLLLLLPLCLCALPSIASALQFDRVWRRLCLQDEFRRRRPDVASDRECAYVCASEPDCQGFRLLPASSACETFVFDRCGHSLNSVGCSNFEWIFVRARDGIPKGSLCPEDFGNSHLTSSYKMVDASSWTAGRALCNAEKGLAKFADATNRTEATQFHWIKNNVNAGKSFYIGGHRLSTSWLWADCNHTLVNEVWGVGQPNQNGDRTDIWSSHSEGVDDDFEAHISINHALCECVNPF